MSRNPIPSKSHSSQTIIKLQADLVTVLNGVRRHHSQYVKGSCTINTQARLKPRANYTVNRAGDNQKKVYAPSLKLCTSSIQAITFTFMSQFTETKTLASVGNVCRPVAQAYTCICRSKYIFSVTHCKVAPSLDISHIL